MELAGPLGLAGFCTGINRFRSVDKKLDSASPHTGDVDRITDFFNLVVAYNSGAAFSFLADAGGWQRPLFAGLAIVVSLVICVIIARNSSRKFLCLGLALVLSGALGNAWDRFTIGVVVDFLDFHVGSYHWPAFNVADICICCGAGIVVLAEFFGKKN